MKYKDEKSTNKIGKNIRSIRLEKGYTQEDIHDMTGFSINTISAIENGGETSISYILGIAKALETAPSIILEIEFDAIPLFQLSPKSKERVEMTKQIRNLILNSDFFDLPRRVSDVLAKLDIDKSESSKCSVVLNNLIQDGLLKIHTEGSNNLYIKH